MRSTTRGPFSHEPLTSKLDISKWSKKKQTAQREPSVNITWILKPSKQARSLHYPSHRVIHHQTPKPPNIYSPLAQKLAYPNRKQGGRHVIPLSLSQTSRVLPTNQMSVDHKIPLLHFSRIQSSAYVNLLASRVWK